MMSILAGCEFMTQRQVPTTGKPCASSACGVAITSARRSPKLPEVPTVAESGLPGFESTSWYMLLAPAKTPPAVLEKLNADLRRIAAIPEFRSRIEDTGGEVATLSLKESADCLQGEFTRWAKVVQDRNIKAD